MAVQYQSVQTTNNLSSDATNITITKPTSLAVGDLMVTHIVYQSSIAFTPKADWKSLAGVLGQATTLSDGANLKASVQWKVAEASDVAATNFTWNISLGRNAGGIFRIIGQNAAPIGAFATAVVNNTTTPSFANGITPISANSLILALFSGRDQTGASGYAVATDNPTWTERYDMTGTGAYGANAATATRTQTTNTGNSSYTPAEAASTSDYTGFLVAIDPLPDPNLTLGTINVVSSVPTPGLTVPFATTTTAISATVTVPTPTLTKKDSIWSNKEKSSASWTNRAKS